MYRRTIIDDMLQKTKPLKRLNYSIQIWN